MKKYNSDDIDIRNQYCNQIHSKPDTQDFTFDDYCSETIEMARKIDYIDGIFAAQIIQIARHMIFGMYDKSYEELQELVNTYELSSVSLINQMKYYGALVIYNADYKNNLNKAIYYSKIEMKIAEELGDVKELMRIKMNIGALNIDVGFYETAIEFISEACEFYESRQDYILLCYCYLNLGDVYYLKDQYDQAEMYLMKSIDIAIQEHEVNIEYSAKHILGLISVKLNKTDQAIERLKNALKMSEESSEISADYKLNLDLIEVYINSLMNLEALTEISRIEEAVINLPNKENIKLLYKYKARTYENLGDMNEANKALRSYIECIDNEKTISSQDKMNDLIQEEYNKTIERLETIAKVGRELTMLSDIDEVLLRVRKELLNILEVDVLGVGEIIGEELCFNHYFAGEEKVKAMNIPLNKKSSLATWCIDNGKEVIINDLEKEYSKYISNVNRIKGSHSKGTDVVKSLMYAPLKINNEIIGVFTIQCIAKGAYSSVEINIFNIIADYVSIAVKNVSQRIALENLSERDSLTKMYNRRGFIDFFDQYMFDPFREVTSVAIIMLDLDFFKSVNDKYGHLVGDEVLVVVARSLMDKEDHQVRSGRLGGEEFALILMNKDYDEVTDVAEQIRLEIEALNIYVNDTNIKVTTSVGVTYTREKTKFDYNQLYYEADHALYTAKANGRNTVEIYKSIN